MSSEKIYKKYNVVKGRMAEALVQNLLETLDYNVFHYGKESTMPELTLLENIKKIKKKKYNPVLDHISNQPDFVVNTHRNTFFVEVKYKDSGFFYKGDIEQYSHPETIFIIVSLGGIYLIEKSEADKLPENPKTKISLEKHCIRFEDSKLFRLDDEQREIINKFHEMSHLLFKALPSTKDDFTEKLSSK